jgi:hypothetical protein
MDSSGYSYVSRICAFLVLAALVAISILSAATDAYAGQATLMWNANTESDLAGYKLYYGTSSRTYGFSIDVGNQISDVLSGLQDGQLYYFAVTAYDTSGNESGFSAERSLTIPDTAPPLISAVAVPVRTSSGASITWTTNEASDSQVEYGLTVAYGSSTALNTNRVTSHIVTLSGLATATAYHYRVESRDAAGNLATSGDFTFTTLAAPDITPPTVSLTAPAAGATVTATITVAASASDNVGVVGVQFKLDGVNLGAEVLVAPYAIAWTTRTALNGAHTLTAVARDAAGNIGTSTTVGVTVTNDTTPPAIAITAPAAGVTVTGTVTVTASASDSMGVAGVQFQLDGRPLGVEATVAPYAVGWDTTAVADGPHTLAAVARDAAGNATISAAVSVTVANGSVQVALTPQDTSLNLDAANYSGTTTLMTYTWPDNRVANAIMMKFDLAGIPAGAVVQDATLYLALVQSDATAESTYTVTAHKLVGRNPVIATATGYTADGVTGWTANACCYANVPLAQADISAAYDTRAIDKAPGYKAWTVTAMVKEWQAAAVSNYGLLLNADASKLADHYRYFASMKHPDTTIHPFLRVTYLAPPSLDGTPPTVAITAPAAGVTVTGTVTVTASASDSVGVAGVQFRLDGSPLGTEVTAAPYAVAWNTTTAAGGSHTLTAIARDAAGNIGTSAAVTVTVVNDTPPPIVSGVTASSITAAGSTISWTTNTVSDSQVEYGTTTAYGSMSALNPSLVASHVVTLGGLTDGTVYHFRVRSRDAAGNLAISGDLTFTTLDGTPPAVAITAPAAGATVGGMVTVTASASDSVGVAGVQFRLDGSLLGTEVTAAPYAFGWNTTAVPDGLHTLTAVARDAAGNATTSAVAVTVANRNLQISLSPHDTSLNLDATNYSGYTKLMTYTWPDNRVANAIVMKFDFSGIPAGAVVQEATLYLALVESDGAPESTYTVPVHKMVGRNPVIAKATGYRADAATGWTPNACCYGNVPLAQADISPAYDTQAIDKTPGYKAWTVTAMVREWLAAPASNFGLLLNSDVSKLRDRYRNFASMHHPDSTIRPFLRVTYTIALVHSDGLPERADRVTAHAVGGKGPLVAASVTSVDRAFASMEYPVVSTAVHGRVGETPRQTALRQRIFAGPLILAGEV